MTRALDLTRDEAELLDDLLLEHVRSNPQGFNALAPRLARELWTTWGMTAWDQRPAVQYPVPTGRKPS